MAAKTEKTCKANVGSRKQPRPCGKPLAPGMLAACSEHKTTMIATSKPGIYYRGGSYVVVTVHGGKQHKTYHRKHAEAVQAKANRTGTDNKAPASRVPFDQYARQWIKDFQGRTDNGLDPGSRAFYERALELYAIPHWGSTPLRKINSKSVKQLVTSMQARGLAPASVRTYLAPVKALFADAVHDGDMTVNPASATRVNPKARGVEPSSESEKTLTEAEVAALLGQIPDRYRLLFSVLSGTGVRIAEALGLDWTDLEQRQDGTIMLHVERQWCRGKLKPPKTKSGVRVIRLDPVLGGMAWAEGADRTGPMFRTTTGGRLSDRNLRRVLDTAAAGAALPPIGFHILRHTHGSVLIASGKWSVADVSKRLGHANPAITAKVYTHALRDSEPDLSFLGNWAKPEQSDTRGRAGIARPAADRAVN